MPTDVPTATEEASASWSVAFSAYAYFVPDDRDYFQPTFIADHGLLHLEGRYNYEALETGSAWVGLNFSAGKRLSLDITPIAGAVVGDVMGVGVGYEATLTWRALELYSEGEFVYDTGTSADSFLYAWTELTLSPVEWFKLGVAVQRTRAQENHDVQPGVLVSLSFDHVEVAAYAFDFIEDVPTFVVAVELAR